MRYDRRLVYLLSVYESTTSVIARTDHAHMFEKSALAPNAFPAFTVGSISESIEVGIQNY